MVCFVAEPNTNKSANAAEQDTPQPEHVAVVEQAAEPAANDAAEGDADANRKFHTVSVARLWLDGLNINDERIMIHEVRTTSLTVYGACL